MEHQEEKLTEDKLINSKRKKKVLKADSLDKTGKLTYNIINFFARFTKNLSKKLKDANRELNFLKYQMLFGERDEDIYISTFPKSGTTLMQMMLYQMTTDGNMDFEHVYEKSPWIRNDSFMGIEPLELPNPRIIKTHDNYNKFDKDTKGKFVYVLRNGMDVAVSLYHQDKNFKNPNLTFDAFYENFIRKSKHNWFDHTKDWLKNENNLPILYVKYEEIITDLKGTIEKVASFFNIQLTDEIIERTITRCSFDYMKQYEDKFGLLPIERAYRNQEFFRKGKAGDSTNYFTQKHMEQFNKRYVESGLNKYL